MPQVSEELSMPDEMPKVFSPQGDEPPIQVMSDAGRDRARSQARIGDSLTTNRL